MKKIKSFCVDHTKLGEGIYLSRVDGECKTYDLRFCRPNTGVVLDNVTMHTIEHMLATFSRNSEFDESVVYFGPMGCQTGFYLVVRNEEPKKVFEITKQLLKQILEYEGPVFGASAIECGHYENLSLDEAKIECQKYLEVLEAQTNMEFSYPKED